MEPEQTISLPGPWTHSTVSANSCRFHVTSMGEGPLVVFLHGFPGFWWTWRTCMAAVAKAGFRAVAIDLRGYCGSDHPPRGYDIPTATHDVASVIRSLGARQAFVVGQGMGGLIAWAVAALQPEVVAGLCVMGSAHPERMRHAMMHDRAQLMASKYLFGFQRPWIPERQLVADNAAMVERLLHQWSADSSWLNRDTADTYRAAMQVSNTAHCSVEYFRWVLRSIPRPDGRRFVQRIGAASIASPVLHLHGAADRTVLPRTCEGSDAFVSGDYDWQLLPELGHLIHEESPKVVNGLLVNWLATHQPQSSVSQ